MIIISCNKQSLKFRHQVRLVLLTRVNASKRSYPGGNKPPIPKSPSNLPKPPMNSPTSIRPKSPDISSNTTSPTPNHNHLSSPPENNIKEMKHFINSTNPKEISQHANQAKLAEGILKSSWPVKPKVSSHNNTVSLPIPPAPSHQELSTFNDTNKDLNNNVIPLTNIQKKPFLDDIKSFGKNKENNDNLKPSDIFKSQSGKLFTTNINQQTTINTISDQDLILEMKKRELIKEDKGNTAVIKTDTNDFYAVGKNSKSIKLTSLGYNYFKQIAKPGELEFNNCMDKEFNIEYQIGILHSNQTNLNFINTGKQLHLVIAYNRTANEYRIIGYLTSKTEGIKLADLQFEIFQKKQEKTFISEQKIQKSQYFVKFDNEESITEDNFIKVKWGIEYIKKIDQKDFLDSIRNDLNQKPFRKYKAIELTKEDALKICQEYDKKQQILSQDEIEKLQLKSLKEELNKEKQKIENAQIKYFKNNNNEETIE